MVTGAPAPNKAEPVVRRPVTSNKPHSKGTYMEAFISHEITEYVDNYPKIRDVETRWGAPLVPLCRRQ